MQRESSLWAKLGAVTYLGWSALHFQAAYSVYKLGVAMDPSIAQGRVMQDAWNLLWFSIAAAGTAIALNWRNSVWGFWINFGVLGVADTGFIFFVLLRGYIGVWPGLLGPVFWIAGVCFTTLASAAGTDIALPRSPAEEPSSAMEAELEVWGGETFRLCC